MNKTEVLRVVMFATAVIAVYVMTPAILLRWLRSRGKEHFLNRWLDVLIVVAALVGVVCVVDGFREPYRPEVTHHTVAVTNMPRGGRVRLVQISDLHSSVRPRLEERLPEIIAAEHPDVIVFTGDAVNQPQGLPMFRKMMSRLTEIAPVFAVRGNWDNGEIYSGTQVKELRGDAAELKVRGQRIEIVGEGLYGAGVRKTLQDLPPDAVSVALMHSPDSVYEAPHAGLVLAGHTHGGQIRLPWYGALITLSKYGKRFEAGLYRVNDSWLYVNRGIGMEDGAPVRFLCRPEVAVIDLVAPER